MERSSSIINGGKSKAKKGKRKKKIKWQWEKSIDAIAQRYKCDWDDVTSWNILTFMHRSEFYKNELKEKKEEAMQVFIYFHLKTLIGGKTYNLFYLFIYF